MNYKNLEHRKEAIIKLMLREMPNRQFDFTQEDLDSADKQFLFDGWLVDDMAFRLTLTDAPIPEEF